MRVGIPTEIKEDENRVAITPAGVTAFKVHGHDVVVQSGPGKGSHISDGAYRAAGSTIADEAADVWQQGDLILKVKEPLPTEYDLLRPGQVIFTWPRATHSCRSCWRARSSASDTRPCSSLTEPCRCWSRCPKWQGACRFKLAPSCSR